MSWNSHPSIYTINVTVAPNADFSGGASVSRELSFDEIVVQD